MEKNKSRIGKWFEEEHISDVVLRPRGDFTAVKQVYDDQYPETFVCRNCGSDKFIVGHGGYFTAIKCDKCNYEICVHDG